MCKSGNIAQYTYRKEEEKEDDDLIVIGGKEKYEAFQLIQNQNHIKVLNKLKIDNSKYIS